MNSSIMPPKLSTITFALATMESVYLCKEKKNTINHFYVLNLYKSTSHLTLLNILPNIHLNHLQLLIPSYSHLKHAILHLNLDLYNLEFVFNHFNQKNKHNLMNGQKISKVLIQYVVILSILLKLNTAVDSSKNILLLAHKLNQINYYKKLVHILVIL